MNTESFDIAALKFDDRGLIPAIVVDTETGRVLTLAYMNAQSLRISMEKGLTCFYSRSRQALCLPSGDGLLLRRGDLRGGGGACVPL